MLRVLILGNSGAGKSHLARQLAHRCHLDHLDLDSIAWQPDQPGVRSPVRDSGILLNAFENAHPQWVMEGGYTSLLELAVARATELVFLNPDLDSCLANCRSRPWEAHKYPSPAAQDANLSMLLGWVADYYSRQDEFSFDSHRKFFQSFPGPKTELTSNTASSRFAENYGTTTTP